MGEILHEDTPLIGDRVLTWVSRYDGCGVTLVYRELVMMRVMNAITDKPEWERKVCSCESRVWSAFFSNVIPGI